MVGRYQPAPLNSTGTAPNRFRTSYLFGYSFALNKTNVVALAIALVPRSELENEVNWKPVAQSAVPGRTILSHRFIGPLVETRLKL
jgi:hypothetical protein